MIGSFTSSAVSSFPNAGGQIISGFAVVDATGGPFLYAVSYGGTFVTRFDISGQSIGYEAQDTLTLSGTPIGLGAGLHFAEFGGQDRLFLSGFDGDDTSVLSISADGSISQTPAYLGDLGSLGKVTTYENVTVGGADFLYAADHISGRITGYSTNLSALAFVSDAPIPADAQGSDIRALSSVSAHGESWLAAADQANNKILLYRAATSGELALTDTLGAADGLGVSQPSALAMAAVQDRAFVIVVGGTSNSLSVLEVMDKGGLIVRDHVLDTLDTRFQGGAQIAVTQSGDRPLITVSGNDDGFSVFSLTPSGRLFHEISVADSLQTTLDNVSALTTHLDGNALSIFAASQSEQGISLFTTDLANFGSVFAGADGEDTLSGTALGDILSGGNGNDALNGADGADLLEDGEGADTLTGGSGADVFALSFDLSTDEITDFDKQEDRLDLSAFEQFHGYAQLAISTTAWGASISYGGDTTNIYTSDGQSLTLLDFYFMDLIGLDRLSVDGLPQDQRMIGTSGADTLIGGAGNDTIAGREGADFLSGGTGRDFVDYSQSASGLVADLVLANLNTGDAAGDTYQGMDGIIGTAFADTLRGGYVADTLTGGDGADVLIGREGDDVILGGDGDDYLRGGRGNDYLEGGAGRDFADYAQSTEGLVVDFVLPSLNTGEASGDTFKGMDGIYGSNHDDTLRGSYYADTLSGGAGEDQLVGREGNDFLVGGDGDDFLRGGRGADTLEGSMGRDFADYAQSTEGLIVDFVVPSTNTGEAAGDIFKGMDGIYGSAHDDTLRGSFYADTLDGGSGNDRLTGRSGNDLIIGGAGNDIMTGGPGTDMFQFNAGQDEVSDYSAGETLWFDPALWGGAAWDASDILAVATANGGQVVFDFGGLNTLTLIGAATTAGLEDDIFIL